MLTIGLDIGTTNTVVAVLRETGEPQVVLNGQGEPITPSAIYFENGKDPVFGREALSERLLQPERVLTCFKRRLGSNDTLYTDAKGRDYTATHLTSLLIRHMVEFVEKHHGEKVSEAVISVPANFKDYQKQAVLDAADQAGVRALRLIHEPTAAGIAYALHRQQNKTFLVFDLGGGTFDVSVLRANGTDITVLGSHGIERLGGEDFTAKLSDELLDRFEKEHGFRPKPNEDPTFYAELAEKSEQVKHSLSRKDETRMVIACRGQQIITTFTREEFEASTKNLVQQCMDCTQKAVDQVGLSWKGIDTILQVGGATRMPCIQKALEALTGHTPRNDVDPDRAVAFGAALQCGIEQAKSGRTPTYGGRAIPMPSAFVREVTTHNIGCCVADSKGNLTNAVVLPKGTPIPARKTDRFALQHDNQTVAKIEVLQGEEGADYAACQYIGHMELDGLPPEPIKSQRIEVTYSLDLNGIFDGYVKDLVSDRESEIQIDYRNPADTPSAEHEGATQ